MQKKLSVILCIGVVALTLAGCGYSESGGKSSLGSGLNLFDSYRKLPDGTFLEDLDLSGLNYEAAKARIQTWEQSKQEYKLRLTYNATKIELGLAESGIRLDFEKSWENVLNNSAKKASSVLALDPLKAGKALEQKLTPLNQNAVDASYKIEDDRFIITADVPAKTYATEAVLEEIRKNLSFEALQKYIEVPTVSVPAAITADSFNKLAFDGAVAEYTTNFNSGDTNRTTNLRTAAAKIDKTILKPGDTFSYNQSVGQRTAEAGFKDAYIIIGDEFVQGMGGGICQVSSTLYTAAVLADLKIIERTPHAVTIAYLPLGQDATINYPNLDLKLRNDGSSLIYIRTFIGGGKLTVRIYGKQSDKTVRFVHETEKVTDFPTITKVDSGLAPGKVVQDQPGSKGYVVKTWKVIRDSAGNQTEQFLSRDVYAPSPKILRVGEEIRKSEEEWPDGGA